MVDWIEIKMSVDGEAAEAVAELLQRFGHQGVSIEQEGIMPDAWDDGEVPPPQRLTVRAYLPDDHRAAEARQQLETALGHMNMMYPMPTPIYTVVKEADWAEAWKAHYHPVRIGRRLLIRPQWIEVTPRPDDVVLALDPGMAFGTGTHPTTQLCLEALEARVEPGIRLLDLGCGSGILAIAGVKLGAVHALALDNDPLAVEATLVNAQQNDVADKITVEEGSLENLRGSARRFDMIVVNILARVIIEMCDQGLGQIVRPGGLAIFSGIIEEQAADVESALQRTGLEPFDRHQQGDWVAIVARRPHTD
jgi:ribosomal protein L11 methyltransferase